jgi:hypothetical protein
VWPSAASLPCVDLGSDNNNREACGNACTCGALCHTGCRPTSSKSRRSIAVNPHPCGGVHGGTPACSDSQCVAACCVVLTHCGGRCVDPAERAYLLRERLAALRAAAVRRGQVRCSLRSDYFDF